MSGDAGWGYVVVCAALASITLGTLYQKRYCGQIDWRAGNIIQFVASGILYGLAALLFEDRVVHWTPQFILGVSWLVFALSIGSIGVLYWQRTT